MEERKNPIVSLSFGQITDPFSGEREYWARINVRAVADTFKEVICCARQHSESLICLVSLVKDPSMMYDIRFSLLQLANANVEPQPEDLFRRGYWVDPYEKFYRINPYSRPLIKVYISLRHRYI